MRYLILLCLLPFCAAGQTSLPSIGQWREHLPYQVAVDVTASEEKVYAATPLSLFSVDVETMETERFSKINGLSETGISTIRYDASSKKLYIAYSNSNLDVLTPGGIRNIPDIKRSTLPGDKNIYNIYPDGSRCYLSTGLGVVVADADKYEVKESWFIGDNGSYVKTNGFAKTTAFFYAATEQGLKRTPLSNPAPADFRTWQTVSGTGGLAFSPARGVATLNNKVIVLQNDSVFVENGAVWTLFFANGWPVASLSISNNRVLLCQQKSSGEAQVVVLNESGTLQQLIRRAGKVVAPQKAITVAGDYWIADRSAGLVHVAGSSIENFKPNSPQNIVLGEMTTRNGTLWATAGSVNSSWNYQYNPSGVFTFSDSYWSAYNLYSLPQLDSVLDFVSVAVDPRDNTAWAGSFGGGLVHFESSGPKLFKQNSPLGPTIGDPGSYRVAGLAFDADNNLWVANFGASRQLHVLKSDNTWQSFAAPFVLAENAVAQIVIDDIGQKWIQSPLGNGLLVFDEGALENPADDKWRLYKTGTGQGNLPSNEVLCLARDKDGFIWVGTTNGVAVFQCTPDALGSGCEAILPVIKEGVFANYLFKGQEVRSIAVDGANRKWMATGSGVWLIAPDGDKVLANYTETNSPLFSNDVRKITIDGRTGEVFIATAKGLLSFRGGATDAEETKSHVLVFPNPVPPGFTGTIGIRGLPENSLVKITETNGRLVYQTRSLGGQAIWDGRDYKGRKAATGVYLVIAVDNLKGEQVVTKIVFVR
ncbi:type IX secretion system anionic LPS delivery protein PorZ [Flavisolibacter nicotianae]|uniref:type IX secretion system anionic LPS delivery protein PorZ n=1 Tax=Flavisolibacter nicotianae TaxID=2364882 RepID=UPI000EAD097D|nr:two-component regulator propeller domain-containing protein [Flavisolibacter nicotianae]